VSVEANLGALRALTLEGGVARALSQGRRAVATAEAGADGALVWSLASFGHALSFAGAAGEAWNAALAAVQHPEAERRPVAQAVARSTLALVAVEQGRLVLARGHAEKAKSLIGRVRSSRSWIGAVAATALGVVFAAEGHLVEAERELVHAEPFFRDEVPTVHHAWVLLLVARVRCRRGRLDEAQSALRAALEELDAIADGGVLPELAAGLEAELGLATALAHDGRVVDQPSDAELAVLRLLTSDLSAREIGKVLFLSQNTVRTHTRVLYRKLGVNSRVEAVGRATALGYLARAGAGAGAR
jgi:LuxR family maltose regulon positive regulatory protein